MTVLKEVTCMCGWQTRGTDDEIVRAIQEHGEQAHGQRPTREEILALAVELGTSAGDA
jgi:predicted small metal-binding protein